MYVGVSPSKFDELVKDGRAPGPFRIDSRKIWDILDLDLCIEDLKCRGGDVVANSWGDM
jgi:hypothetical protein